MKVRSIEAINEDALEAKLEDSIFLRVIDYGLAFPDGFSYPQLIEGLKLELWERKIIDEYLEAAYKNAYNKRSEGVRGIVETPFFVVQQGATGGFMHQDHKYIVSFDAHFKFIDYHELKFARENAKEARKLSLWAIAISFGALLISAIMPIMVAQWSTQTIIIDEEQLRTIQTSLQGKENATTTNE